VAAHGNRFSTLAFLCGRVAAEPEPADLAADPESFDFLIAAAARRARDGRLPV